MRPCEPTWTKEKLSDLKVFAGIDDVRSLMAEPGGSQTLIAREDEAVQANPNGLEVAKALAAVAGSAIIFCTSFDQFAIAALGAVAPANRLNPLTAGIAAPVAPEPSPWMDEFWVPRGTELIRIDARDVDRIEAERDYMRLHVGTRSYLLHQTIRELERRLDPAQFIRVHRSEIVRRDRIARLHHDGLGAWSATLKDGTDVRIGRNYKDAVRDAFRPTTKVPPGQRLKAHGFHPTGAAAAQLEPVTETPVPASA